MKGSRPGTQGTVGGRRKINIPSGLGKIGSLRNINGDDIKRPNTTAMGMKPPYKGMPVNRPFTGITGGISNGMTIGNFMGGRATSAANAFKNPKLRRFENLIFKLKKILESEKKNLRQIKTLSSKEIDQRNQLEKILRYCVDDVKNEIQKKKTESKVQYYQKPVAGMLGGNQNARRGGGGMGKFG